MRDNPYIDATAGAMLASAATRFGDREAIVATDCRFSYAAFLSEARRFAAALLALGVRKNAKVALWLPNRPAWLFAQYGCGTIGAVVVALNPRYKAHELRYILAQSDSTTLILTDHLGPVDFLDTLHEVLPELRDAEPGALRAPAFPHLARVIVDAPDPYAGCLSLAEALDEAAVGATALDAAAAAVAPDDPFTILYTSGTTSFPRHHRALPRPHRVVQDPAARPHRGRCAAHAGPARRQGAEGQAAGDVPGRIRPSGPPARSGRGRAIGRRRRGPACSSAHIRTIWVWIVSDRSRPPSSVTRVCHTIVRLPR